MNVLTKFAVRIALHVPEIIANAYLCLVACEPPIMGKGDVWGRDGTVRKGVGQFLY